MDFQLQNYGECGVLLNRLDETVQMSLVDLLETAPPEGFAEYVLGYENLLILFEDSRKTSDLQAWLVERLESEGVVPPSGRLIEVPTRYNGADLKTIGEQVQLSVDEVVALHSGAEYRVRMLGFSPGFPYLDGLDSRLHLERRASPRNRIAPGSVAIGGSHAGIYSVASPGGWHLLGETVMEIFRPDRARGSSPDPDAVFALRLGDRVKFKRVD